MAKPRLNKLPGEKAVRQGNGSSESGGLFGKISIPMFDVRAARGLGCLSARGKYGACVVWTDIIHLPDTQRKRERGQRERERERERERKKVAECVLYPAVAEAQEEERTREYLLRGMLIPGSCLR